MASLSVSELNKLSEILVYNLVLLSTTNTPGIVRTRIIDDSSEQKVQYNFRYAVEDPVNNVFNDHWEHRIGDFVKGGYSLLDPDGKIRTVLYEVDGKRGFRAYIRRKKPGPYFYTTRILKKHYTPFVLRKPVGRITVDQLDRN
ncbi:larval cuticle protein A2B-like [Chrysoperla carnea]|uniref:larval cuticle protein A2B-like n=1 Tax=Chrysoperla carnea TaxID=189513 RepID=UPI001D08FFAA|nr:larval cuticle protein A2B-like [Chrysoperla carnea]